MESLFDAQAQRRGFRLIHFELYNWGTFDRKVVMLKMDGDNALLTGDIGSGKSTIVDALTTLLVSPGRIVYNKAAGAGSRERTLYSYVAGAYRTEKDEALGQLKAKTLRDHNNFTVLLGRFENEGLFESLTLALFLYLKPGNRTPERFYVVSRDKLNIEDNFIPPFKDIRALKKRLKQDGCELFESYRDYFSHIRRVLGIRGDQAMQLFYQTVSMKSVGNLTDFVREHMLEAKPIEKSVDELIASFSELKRAHDAVLEAKEEIALLKPICENIGKYQKKQNELLGLERLSKLIGVWFAKEAGAIYDEKLSALDIEVTKLNSRLKQTGDEVERLFSKESDLRLDIERSGGGRLAGIEKELQIEGERLESRHAEHRRYSELLKTLGKRGVSNEHTFLSLRQEFEGELTEVQEKREKVEANLFGDRKAYERLQERAKEIEKELIYLKARKSNIPQNSALIREQICDALGIKESDLPFAGELLKPLSKPFRGAIERVLRNFALSLLVDTRYYEQISDYVENHHLNGRLVYLKIDTSKEYEPLLFEDSTMLYSQMEVKSDTPFYDYLRHRLYYDFDYRLCEDISCFRRHKKALTKHGQVRQSGSRHEKDDRYDINDERRFVLGWENREKIEKLQEDLNTIHEKIDYLKESIKASKLELQTLENRRDTLRDVLRFEIFETIDYYTPSHRIEELKDEQKRLRESNDKLKVLEAQLKETKEARLEAQKSLSTLQQKLGELNTRISQLKEKRDSAYLKYEQFKDELEEELERIVAFVEEEGLNKLNLVNINSNENRAKEILKNRIESIKDQRRSLQNSIEKGMLNYLNRFTHQAKELDASIDASSSYLARYEKLRSDDLPRFEKNFKNKFKEGTITQVIQLSARLDMARKEITQKISMINGALKLIEYNPDTYIELLAEPTKDTEISAFRSELKMMTTGAIDRDDESGFSEEKFIMMKDLIERFAGRKGFVDIDAKWRKKVIDVRNWFTFGAVERYVSDETVKEYYADSAGKSGGQKEKLAYTVLASALAYQFGLIDTNVKSRTFRFAMIDEAFGKGSDTSARYALELFKKLDLQLLVVTPKQKIHVIEPFVKSIHFVYNKDGKDSNLVSLDIESYREQKEGSFKQ
ncbi:ATP-binding protein [Hydrogenimonas thermophila]|uniref:Uncharacterized protein YPO0396 n=1 Tax=Hydrogenimonas thermophila TaxID=223786 RepID=A0A1I5SUE4_9BACT|nr:ATP-binding protein [Hydrogenimonas thermophila]SFP73876.1 Uncharacterized protein YPO0396 [Hydrogenimonas thermophila]